MPDIAYVSYLESLSLVEALWWFIENHGMLTGQERDAIFFRLRERVRTDR